MKKINVTASCEIIKQKCDELKITPKQLQEQLKVTVTAPYIWLNGKGIPKIETLINLSEMLGCEPMDLIITEEVDELEDDPTEYVVGTSMDADFVVHEFVEEQ